MLTRRAGLTKRDVEEARWRREKRLEAAEGVTSQSI
jgi:hypothetical protein